MQKLVEGVVVANSNCLVVEDIITTGSSVLETVSVLQDIGVGVSRAVVLLDREQGGQENIEKRGVAVTSVMTLSQLITFLLDASKITKETVAVVTDFLSNNSSIPLPNHTPNLSTVSCELTPPFSAPPSPSIPLPPSPSIPSLSPSLPPFPLPPSYHPFLVQLMSYEDRADLCTHPLGKKLLRLMADKKTNLALSADVTTSQRLIKVKQPSPGGGEGRTNQGKAALPGLKI